jgi:exosome complex component RRP4
LTLKSKGLGVLEDGRIIKINPHKVPRVIGKEGSMVSLIKSETGCEITVGQNGAIWIQGEKIENLEGKIDILSTQLRKSDSTLSGAIATISILQQLGKIQ